MMLHRQLRFMRRARLVFMLGVFPMWKRTEGNPKGYQPRPKNYKRAWLPRFRRPPPPPPLHVTFPRPRP
jgi:hypothetical protein